MASRSALFLLRLRFEALVDRIIRLRVAADFDGSVRRNERGHGATARGLSIILELQKEPEGEDERRDDPEEHPRVAGPIEAFHFGLLFSPISTSRRRPPPSSAASRVGVQRDHTNTGAVPVRYGDRIMFAEKLWSRIAQGLSKLDGLYFGHRLI